jgi:hypothetical protein
MLYITVRSNVHNLIYYSMKITIYEYAIPYPSKMYMAILFFWRVFTVTITGNR